MIFTLNGHAYQIVHRDEAKAVKKTRLQRATYQHPSVTGDIYERLIELASGRDLIVFEAALRMATYVTDELGVVYDFKMGATVALSPARIHNDIFSDSHTYHKYQLYLKDILFCFGWFVEFASKLTIIVDPVDVPTPDDLALEDEIAAEHLAQVAVQRLIEGQRHIRGKSYTDKDLGLGETPEHLRLLAIDKMVKLLSPAWKLHQSGSTIFRITATQ